MASKNAPQATPSTIPSNEDKMKATGRDVAALVLFYVLFGQSLPSAVLTLGGLIAALVIARRHLS